MLKLIFMPVVIVFQIIFLPVRIIFSLFGLNYSFGKKKDYSSNNIWNLSEEDRKIAKSERMSDADYIEAEERDDDNLDNDD